MNKLKKLLTLASAVTVLTITTVCGSYSAYKITNSENTIESEYPIELMSDDNDDNPHKE